MSDRDEIVRLPWLDLWERKGCIYAALGGVRLELRPIEDAPVDGPHWRAYLSARTQGLGRDIARPTNATPKGWAAVHRQRAMAAIGMQAPFYQRELGLDPEED